ncbi:MAG TPA: hypothetical protein VHH88_06805, partial [Verrucomicrobiae bacterium]|nr:hypothetical protein [Verrucomicrobiae bacterium]
HRMLALNYVTGISLLVALLGVWQASALELVYHLGDVFSGTAPASSVTPWADIDFADVSPGVVRLAVTNLNLTASENLESLYLNLNPADNPLSLTLTLVTTSGGFDTPTISLGLNSFKADGDGRYDILFSFATGGMDNNRFTDNEYMVYDISGIPGLSASDFVYMSQPDGGHGPFYAAAHVQRIGSDSGWIDPSGNMYMVVPEPATGSLALLAGLMLLARKACAKERRTTRGTPAPRADNLMMLPRNDGHGV